MNRTFRLACIALLTALSVVSNFMTIQIVPNIAAVSLTITVGFLTGIYFGIGPALFVGYFGDLIAHLIHPYGPYNWFLALSYALFGVICALVYKLPIKVRFVKLLIALVVTFVVCGCGINTFGLWLQYKVGVEPGLMGLISFLTSNKQPAISFWTYLYSARLPFLLLNYGFNGVVVAILQQTNMVDKLMVRIKEEK